MENTIIISDKAFYNELQKAAADKSITMGEQALRWMKIGKALEASAQVNDQNVEAALSGQLAYDELTAEEQRCFMANLGTAVDNSLKKNFTKHLNSLDNVAYFHGLNENGEIISETNS